jgi:hypothetical protein
MPSSFNRRSLRDSAYEIQGVANAANDEEVD